MRFYLTSRLEHSGYHFRIIKVLVCMSVTGLGLNSAHSRVVFQKWWWPTHWCAMTTLVGLRVNWRMLHHHFWNTTTLEPIIGRSWIGCRLILHKLEKKGGAHGLAVLTPAPTMTCALVCFAIGWMPKTQTMYAGHLPYRQRDCCWARHFLNRASSRGLACWRVIGQGLLARDIVHQLADRLIYLAAPGWF